VASWGTGARQERDLVWRRQRRGDLRCDSGYGRGTIFKITATGMFSVLRTFTGGDGATPQATMIRDSAGNLYGTTVFGGPANLGTIFQLDLAGKLTVLHDFLGSPDDGANPWFAPLTRDTAGNFYGVTTAGGDYGTQCVITGGSCGVAGHNRQNQHPSFLHRLKRGLSRARWRPGL